MSLFQAQHASGLSEEMLHHALVTSSQCEAQAGSAVTSKIVTGRRAPLQALPHHPRPLLALRAPLFASTLAFAILERKTVSVIAMQTPQA